MRQRLDDHRGQVIDPDLDGVELLRDLLHLHLVLAHALAQRGHRGVRIVDEELLIGKTLRAGRALALDLQRHGLQLIDRRVHQELQLPVLLLELAELDEHLLLDAVLRQRGGGSAEPHGGGAEDDDDRSFHRNVPAIWRSA